MALEFARSHVISRSDGRTAVKAAAYRSGEALMDDRVGRIANYSHRANEVGHSEVLLPPGADISMKDRVTLWEAVEAREDQHNRRASAQLAIDHIIALPIELTKEQHLEMARGFAKEQFVSKGLVVDLAIHYHSEGNPHAHLLTTTRTLQGVEFGGKLRDLAGKFYGGQKIPQNEQIRHRWADFQNQYFREHQIDAHVRNNDGEFVSQVHLGPVHAISGRGVETAIQEKNAARISARDEAILNHPEIIIERVSDRKSLFTSHDLYREMSSLISSTEVFSRVKAAIDSHDSLIKISLKDRPFLTTQKVLDSELNIRLLGDRLGRDSTKFAVSSSDVERALSRYDFLSEEQRDAAKHLTKGNRISLVVGLAGAGKSTMLRAVKEAYQDTGHSVSGLTLAGKASEELQISAGIESRTIASWLLGVKQGRVEVNEGDVLVMDEAGMNNNKTTEQVLEIVNRAGAKIIMVGDAEQLQPIQAGSPFRDLTVQQGFAEIGTIRRQSESWQRDATKALSEGRGKDALAAYEEHGHVHSFGAVSDAKERLVQDFLADSSDARIVLAHRNKDVRDLNTQIRQELVEQGKVDPGQVFRSPRLGESDVLSWPFDLRSGDAIRFGRDDKPRGIEAGGKGTYIGYENGRHHVRLESGKEYKLSPEDYGDVQHATSEKSPELVVGRGDRVLFTKNDKALGVKNGTLGTVLSNEKGTLSVSIDNKDEPITFSYDDYSDVALGYAATVHKSQGMTVDRTFVLGTGTMNKHLGYVGMSRHRDILDVYVANDTLRGKSFADIISQADRQETVLDLAERHGLELNPEYVDPMRFMKQFGDREDLAVEQQNVSSHNVPIPKAPSLQEATEAIQAQRDLDNMTRKILDKMEAQHKSSLVPLAAKVNEARKTLEEQASQKPKAGFFTSKKLVESWEKERRQLEIVQANANRAYARVVDDYSSRSNHRQWEAEKQAGKELPKQAELIARHESREHARVLVEKWKTLERDLMNASDGHRQSGSVGDIRQALAKVFQDIDQSKMVRSTMNPEQVRAFGIAKASNAKEIANSKTRDRGFEH
ncbi:AAA family ATPase [Maritalea sp.]|uniref:AAA family ATPase n=1 Tax=Maritalea sp. TaxID=2003361 RepID=UPI003EF25269